jgi:hypothetical protein
MMRAGALHPDETLCFIHIPKTGGLTMRSILDRHFAFAEICPADSWPMLRGLSKEQLSRYRLVRGHFAFNIDARLLSKPVYMTLLRDPIERTLSQYDYVRRDPSNGRLHEIVRDKTLEDYLDDEFLREETIRDIQTRFVAPAAQVPDDVEVVAPLSHLGIAQAKINLQQCAFVGVTERMKDSLRLLAHTFGWRPLRSFEAQNVSGTRLTREDLPARVIDKILACTEADHELYAFACELFKQRFDHMVDELLSFRIRRAPRLPILWRYRWRPRAGWRRLVPRSS